MVIRLLTDIGDLARYDRWIKSVPHGTLWQSLAWKNFQDALGRETRIYVAEEDTEIIASALVTIDRTAFGWNVWEMPRGPLAAMNNWQLTIDHLLPAIVNDAKSDRCMSMFYSPQYPLKAQSSPRHLMPEATRILDLTQTEDMILAQMKPKGRYNIGVAQKNGLNVEHSKDIDAFYGLLKVTGDRDGFGILPKTHYETFLKTLEGSFLLMAYSAAQKPIAGLVGVVWNGLGIYYYGASDYAHRASMAPYALQWQAMRYCKDQGCMKYDLLGVAPTDAAVSHPWTGVSAFKEKFGGSLITYPTERMAILRPFAWYVLQMKRRVWR